MPTKLTYEYVKNYIESRNYTLISDSYENAKTKLLLKCPIGHEHKIKFNNFQQGDRCKLCMNKKSTLSYEHVKNYFESQNYQLLSDEYINCEAKLLLKCPDGHIFKKSLSHFKRGQKCTICSNKNASKRQSYSYEYIKSFIESEGYTLLSDTYINNRIKLLLKCPIGHEHEISFSNFKSGKRCKECNKQKNKKRLSFDYVKKYIESYNYQLLSNKYKNNHTKLEVSCDHGHKYKVSFSTFKNGHRCAVCYSISKSSHGEKDVQTFIKNIIPDIICNDRNTIINPLTGRHLELDVYIPSLNKAIEYNGIYWHSKYYQKIKDNIKKKQCLNNNINLLIIEDSEWINNNKMCKDTLLKFLKE